MSKTRIFKIGNAEVFQDKPSEETRKYMGFMEKNLHKKAEDLTNNNFVIHPTVYVNEIAAILTNRKDSEISTVLSAIVSKIRDNQNTQNV